MLKTAVRWNASLVKRLFLVVPLHTVTIVACTLASQVFILIASLLPLKVIILLGSERIPHYFPHSWGELGREPLIFILSAIALGCFISYLLTERLVEWVAQRAVLILENKSNKLEMFHNQQEIAKNAYLGFSRSLSNTVFIALALGMLTIIYPSIAAVLVLYLLLVASIFWWIASYRSSLRGYIQSKHSMLTNLLANFGFLACFFYLIVDFLFLSAPTVIVAILALLVCRQIMSRSASLSTELLNLQKQRIKLDALFFHGKILLPSYPDNIGMWEMLYPDTRQNWITLLLTEITGAEKKTCISKWMQLGQINVGTFRVSDDEQDYLIKVFDNPSKTLAAHELALLSEGIKILPALPLLGFREVAGFRCNIFSLPKGRLPDRKEFVRIVPELREKLLSALPPTSLLSVYRRSKPMLPQRLDKLPFDRLFVAAQSPEDKLVLQTFLQRLPEIQAILYNLPTCIRNSSITNINTIWLIEDSGFPCLLNWEHWGLDPVGCGWPEQESALEQLAPALQKAAKNYKALSTVKPEHAELAAQLFALEQDFMRQKLIQCLSLLPQILSRLPDIVQDNLSEANKTHNA